MSVTGDLIGLLLMYPGSALISAGAVLVRATFRRRIAARRQPKAPAPVDMDVLGRVFLDSAPNRQVAPMLALMVWLGACVLVDIVFPLLPMRSAGSQVIDTRLQAILAIDYVILAPLLLWCYISIARDLQDSSESDFRSSSRIGYIFWWIVLWLACLVFQYITIRTQVGSCTSTPPWLWVDKAPTTCGGRLLLNWQGAAHAALRGLDAMMALGLAATVVCAAMSTAKLGGNSVLETHGSWISRDGYIRCKKSLRRLSIDLILAGALAIAIASLHLVTIKIHRNGMHPEVASTAFVAQFIESTWLVWGIIAITWGCFVVIIIARISGRALDEFKDKKVEELQKLETSLSGSLLDDVRNKRLKATARENQHALDEFWIDYERIEQFFSKKSNPYPLPGLMGMGWLKNQVVASLLINIIASFIFALITVGIGGFAIFTGVTLFINYVTAGSIYVQCPSCAV